MIKNRLEVIKKSDRTLALIRCFQECVDAFSNGTQFPLNVCYHRSKIYYRIEENSRFASFASSSSINSFQTESNLYLFDSPVHNIDDYNGTINNFEYLNSDHVMDRHGIEFLISNGCSQLTNLGNWILITKIKKKQLKDEALEEEEEGDDVETEDGNETIELEHDEKNNEDENNNQREDDEKEEEEDEEEEAEETEAKKIEKESKMRNAKTLKSESIRLKKPLWLLKHRFGEQDNQLFKLVEISEEKQSLEKDWLKYVEEMNNPMSDSTVINKVFKPNLAFMNLICQVPKDWSLCKDEDLALMLKDFINTDLPGSIRNLIRSITVSTQRTSEDADNLISLDTQTYWESDSYASAYNGYNSIRIFLKPNIKIKRLYIVINKKHKQHMPKDVIVMGGENSDEIDEINKVSIKIFENGDILLLENCQKVYNYIEIRIKTCQRNGTNCRVYGVKLFTWLNCDGQVPSEIFTVNKLQKNYPRLSHFDPTFLYRRSQLIVRFIKLFDSILDDVLPTWTHGEYFNSLVKSVKKLLVLSSRRLYLLENIQTMISTTPLYLPLINIDRPLAFAHRGDRQLDPNFQNTIFMQIYNNIGKSHSFRWYKDIEQWWECKFIGEGIIDQGGGFRDSLSDISEELCPNITLDKPLSLPFFIRSPNQLQADSNTFKDTFIPNPSCTLYEEFEFIGKLMGACFRSKETLALYLSPYFWKKLSDENVSWKNDFVTVDFAQVKLLDCIENVDKTSYEEIYANELTWSCTLSDGTLVNLRADGNQMRVEYNDRIEYCELVRKTRLSEFDKQVNAIRHGLESVISKHVFTILTWSEFEYKICGVAKITVEDLKMSIVYDDELSAQDVRVKYFWEAIENFTDEERSKFIRFVTGRKRLPVKIYFCASDQSPSSFPDTSTCNCSIYFPNYPNAKIAEEKLRYAIHNCVAIDTDCSSYEDL